LASSLPPPTLIWDAFGDLPEVDNFDVRESIPYKRKASRPYELYMRRDEGRSSFFVPKAIEGLKVLYADVGRRVMGIQRLYQSHRNEDVAKLELGEKFALSHSRDKERIWGMRERNLSREERDRHDAVREYVLRCTAEHVLRSCDGLSYDYEGPCINHRCTPCNVGGYLRAVLIPEEGDIRSLPGVVCHGNYYCVGHSHGVRQRYQNGGYTVLDRCPGRGVTNKGRTEIVALETPGCPASSVFLPTKELMVKRWMINSVNRHNGNPRKVWGRLKKSDIVGTLLTEVNGGVGYPVLHPYQDRFITIREAARIQGFPDSYIFLASEENCSSYTDGDVNIAARFRQIGNSVSPPVASMLGRCILRAVRHRLVNDPAVMFIADPDMNEAVARSTEPPYYRECGNDSIMCIDLSAEDDVDVDEL